MKFCVFYNQAHYGAFQHFIDMSAIESGYRKETDTKPSMINPPLYSNRASLINAWHAAYMNYPDEFAGLQSRTAYEAYYLPAQRGMLSNYGINIKEYSPALRGLFGPWPSEMERPPVRIIQRMVYDPQRVHILPGLMNGNGLPKYMRQRQGGIRPRETVGERSSWLPASPL